VAAKQSVSVALLGRADEARAQLRQALDELGASVVVEADPTGLDLTQLASRQPQVVLVNLDAALEDALDHLQPVFDDPSVRVVFNEAEVSSQLSGWDRARWARHLAAKLLGHDSINPPTPAGAEVLPELNLMPSPGAPLTPAQEVGEIALEGFAEEALQSSDDVPSELRLDTLPSTGDGFADALGQAMAHDDAELESFDIDLNAIEGALVQSDIKPDVQGTSVPDAPPETDAAINFEFDPSVLDAALTESSSEASPAEAGRQTAASTLDDFSDHGAPGDANLLDDTLAGFNLDEASELRLGDLALDDDAASLEDDADFAALAAQFEAQQGGEADALASEDSDFDLIGNEGDNLVDDFALDLAETEATDVPSTAGTARPAPDKPREFDLSALTLEPIGGDAVAPAAPAPASTQAEEADKGRGAFDFDSLGLSLEPIEEAAGPPEWILASAAAKALAEAQPQHVAVSSSPIRSEGSGEISRVIVLGASIGGPDALRSFLAEIPAHFPALFLIAQHLDSGFFERLSEQLQKVSALPVRMPADGGRVLPGEVVVVGSTERVRLDRKGNIRFEPFEVKPGYTPSIDQVLRDAADTFGAQATAIIFSGMAGDAIEGAAYLVSRGGEVWAQDASSCVVSSMVDGIRSRGLSEFNGSPRELARHCISRFGQSI